MGWLTRRLGYGLWGTVDTDHPADAPHVTVDNSSFSVSDVDWAKQYSYDSNGNLQYEGWAVPGSATSAAVWKIRKYTYTIVSGTYAVSTETWAGGSDSQTNIWDNRTSFSYS